MNWKQKVTFFKAIFKYALQLTVIKGTLGGFGSFFCGFTRAGVKPGLLG